MTDPTDNMQTWPQYDTAALQKLSPTAFKVALRIGEQWGLTQEATLALIGLSELPRDADKVLLTSPQFYRAGLLIGVFRTLNEMFDEASSDIWPTLSNTAPIFKGSSAVQIMTLGGAAAMAEVLQYLRAVQQGY